MSVKELPERWREMAARARLDFAAVSPLQAEAIASTLESCANELEEAAE